MNELHIYPTSRALRTISLSYKTQEGYVPSLMRMDEFEKRVLLLENLVEIDSLQRILLLQKAAKFDAFDTFKVDTSLLKFFTKSETFFKFFEELSAEHVSLEMLTQADAYAEFDTHLEILNRVLHNYKKLLDARGLTDKSFIPNTYKLNQAFIYAYDKIEIHLEGYLSQYELRLLEEVSSHIPLYIHYTTSAFNIKMQHRFKALDIILENNAHTIFSLSTKEIISSLPNESSLHVDVYALEEREEQIAVAFEEIEKMVHSGIKAENIALILPDESEKEHFSLFDKYHNLNFAMGYDYSNGRIYKSLDALYRYWQTYDKESTILLERYGFNIVELQEITSSKQVHVKEFFMLIDALGLHEALLEEGREKESYNERVQEQALFFAKVLAEENLTLKEWLFLWLKQLNKVTTDDVRGGLITVMGVLETRGVSFEGVVIVDFNEGVVPASSSKDQFLNSQVRAFANLPTKNDRESLQKQYYKRLLEQAQKSVILYSTSDNKLPSKFLYELGLEKVTQRQAQFDLLYSQPSQLQEMLDPKVENFDATSIVWSASRLKVFLECKRKYYYQYERKIKAKKEEELNEGSHLHEVLKNLFENNSSYSSKEALEKALFILLDATHPHNDVKASYQKLLWKAKLKYFIETQIVHFNADWHVISREEKFKTTIGGLAFEGRIDRIDQNATDTLVVDYKSGKVEKEPSKLNPDKITDFQMPIYAQLLQGRYQNIRLAYLKIFEKEPMQEVLHLEERSKKLFEHIVTLKQTNAFVATKCEDLQKCKWCPYALMCERGEYL
jgi:RecB family exonuclease